MIEFELTCVLSSTRGLLGCLRVVFVNLRPVDHVVFDVDEIGKLDGMVNAIWRVPYLPQAAPPAPARRHVAAPSRRARRRCAKLRARPMPPVVLPAHFADREADGRGGSSHKRGGKAAIHMVSAFAALQRLVLGQVKVAGQIQRDRRHPCASRYAGSRGRRGHHRMPSQSGFVPAGVRYLGKSRRRHARHAATDFDPERPTRVRCSIRNNGGQSQSGAFDGRKRNEMTWLIQPQSANFTPSSSA
jgi:hypothetical protein